METIFAALYFFCWFVHVLSLILGLVTWYVGSDLFCQSSPLDILNSRIEQDFWKVVLGTTGNAAFIFVLPPYILYYGAETTGGLEPVFLFGHVFSSFATLLWHHGALQDLRKLSTCKKFLNP